MSQSGYDSSQNAGSGGNPGQVFGDYILLEPLSESKTGTVWKAQHRTTGGVLAVKTLSRAAMTSNTMIERFRRQVQILAQLRHPNLIIAYEGGRIEGVPYLVMEFIEGQDLRSLVKRRGPSPVGEAVEQVIQAAAGLGCAHSHGIWHRNVKPGNLMLDRSGAVRVTGFGLAHVEAEEEGNVALTWQGQAMGTGDYMAPEQAMDARSVDSRADIYSLGCTLCMLLTGRPPYRAKSWVQMVEFHLTAPIPSLRAARPEVPQAVDAVFQKMLAKRPEDRYGSMEEVIAALREALAAGADARPDLQAPVLPADAWPNVPPVPPLPEGLSPDVARATDWPELPPAAWPQPQSPAAASNHGGGAMWNASPSPFPETPQPLPQVPLTLADFAPATASARRSARRSKMVLMSLVIAAVLVVAGTGVFWLAGKHAESAKQNAPQTTGRQAETAKKTADERPVAAQPSPTVEPATDETPAGKETVP